MIDWSKISTKELAAELISRMDLFDKEGFLSSDELYRLRCKLGTTICVDAVPVRKKSEGAMEVMAIKRKTGPYAGKFCLIGGILKKDFSIEEGVREHFKNDLGIEIDSITPWNKPIVVCQYQQSSGRESLKDNFLPDPTKDHNIGLVYLVRLKSEEFVFGATSYGSQEVENVLWFSKDAMPPLEEFGYGQGVIFRECLEQAKESRI